jgi:hypothetical protein
MTAVLHNPNQRVISFSLRIGLLLTGFWVNLAHARVVGVNSPSIPAPLAFQKKESIFF